MSIIYVNNNLVVDKRDNQTNQGNQKQVTSFRKQHTIHERFTIKSLIQNIKLKYRIRNILEKLPSRRQTKMQEFHYKLVGDNSDKIMNDKNILENNVESTIFNKEVKQRKPKKNHQNQNKFTKCFCLFKQKLSCSSMKNLIQNSINNLPTIDPNIVWKLIWEFLMCVQTLILCFICSVRITDISDSLSKYSGDSSGLLVAFIIVQSLDMILSANTGYYQRGRLVKNRRQILNKYIKKNGLLDIITLQSLVFELHRWGENISIQTNQWDNNKTGFYEIICYVEAIILLLYFLKGMRITKLMAKLEEELQLNRRSLNILQLCKLFVFVLIVSHIFACIWLFTGKNSDLSVTWLKFYKIDKESWKTQYIRAQYYASVTMITVGYGDTVPQNQTEQVVGMIGMMLSCGVFAYSINSIGNILSEFQKEYAQRKENMHIISQYMREKNVQRHLQSEIREYLEYCWKEWDETQIEKEEQIISQLSDSLRRDLLLQANKTIINDNSLFSQYFSDQIKYKIIHIIKEFKATPNQTIVCDQGPENRKGFVFFVEKGEFDVYYQPLYDMSSNPSNENNINSNNGQQVDGQGVQNEIQNQTSQTKKQNLQQNNQIMKKVKTLGPGESFGFESFFTDKPHNFVVKSRDFCKLLYIDRQDFIELMKNHNLQEDYEKFCFLRDSIINDNNTALLGTKCESCNKFDHTLNECSLVHYTTNKLNLIARFNVSTEIIERSKGNKRLPIRKRANPLINIQYYTDLAYDVISANLEYIEDILNYEDVSYVSSSTFSDNSYDSDQIEYKEEIIDQTQGNNSQQQFKEDETQENQEKKKENKDYSQDIENTINSNMNNQNKDINYNNIIIIKNLTENKLDQFDEVDNINEESLKDKDNLTSSSSSLSDERSRTDERSRSEERSRTQTMERSRQVSFARSKKRNSKTSNFPLHKYDGVINKNILENIDSVYENRPYSQSIRSKKSSNLLQTPSTTRNKARTIHEYLTLNGNSPFNKIHKKESPQINPVSTINTQSNFPQTYGRTNTSTSIQFELQKAKIQETSPYQQVKQLQIQTPKNNQIHQKRLSIFNKDGLNFKSFNSQQQHAIEVKQRKSIMFSNFDFLNNLAARNEGQKARNYGSSKEIKVNQVARQCSIQQTQKSITESPQQKEINQRQIQSQQDDIQGQFDHFQVYSNFKMIDDFEKMQSFKYYYPQYNSERIISKLKKRRNIYLQKQLNAKNKQNNNDDIISVSPYAQGKMQKSTHGNKANIGFIRSQTRHLSGLRGNDQLALKLTNQDSQALSSPTQKKTGLRILNTPNNLSSTDRYGENNQMDLLSFTNSQNMNTFNHENIISQEKLTEAIPKDDFNLNYDQLNSPRDLLLIQKQSSSDQTKVSLFNSKNIKFAPLKKMQIKIKQSSIDPSELESLQ